VLQKEAVFGSSFSLFTLLFQKGSSSISPVGGRGEEGKQEGAKLQRGYSFNTF